MKRLLAMLAVLAIALVSFDASALLYPQEAVSPYQDRHYFTQNEGITAQWNYFAPTYSTPYTTHWVSIAPSGSSATTYLFWAYFDPSASEHTFNVTLSVGDYVARTYQNNSYTIFEESAPFHVSLTWLGLDHASLAYLSSQGVQVAFSGMPGNQYDWVDISPYGSAANGYVLWAYTSSATSGTHVFDISGLATGTYVARAHYNGGAAIEMQTDVFTVSP